MLLCAGLGYRVPGTKTIPEQIAENKTPYYRALESADHAFEAGTIDVSAMESLLEEKLATQLLQVHESARRVNKRDVSKRTPPALSKRPPTMESSVEYILPDRHYTPVYVINLPQAALTSQTKPEPTKGWVERNSALITAISTLLSAIIAGTVAWLLATKK
jgi:hypothetical protein